MKKGFSILSVIGILVAGLVLSLIPVAMAGDFTPIIVTDQTPTEPLENPDPYNFHPRYISGYGSDDSFTVFFEDRDEGYGIFYASTTTGPTGFPDSAEATDITDTHFLIKDWPINIGKTAYAYRAWGSGYNDGYHNFYVSNDLTNWILVSTFTIPNAVDFADAAGLVYYGFHDVIKLNGTYYAFAESNQGQTMIVRSDNGDDVWEAFASVGGRPGWGPLELPSGVSYGWTPSGSFIDLGYDRGYGKIHVDPRDSNFYLAVNTAAKASLPPADLEAAFINPANWTWHDGSTGPAANPILSETSEHDLRECWVVPNTDLDADWVIIYDADFGSGDGGKAIGYATLTPPAPPLDEISGEGFILSKNADFSTDDRVFSRSDTLYMLMWSDEVDFNDIRKEEWELKDPDKNKVKQNFTNNFDNTYTAAFDLTDLPSDDTDWQWKGKIEDNARNKFEVTDNITVLPDGGGNPPAADFTGTPASGTAPLPVSFTDLSTENPTSWSWDFGDDGTSTAQNPSHTYTGAETYTVSLTATNADGSDTETKVDYITVNSGGGMTGEGYILSKNADFSTDDRVFSRSDTLYMLMWSDEVDFNDIRKEEWELKDPDKNKVKQNFTNNFDNTYTAAFDLTDLPSDDTDWQWKGKIEDNNRIKYQPTVSITVNPCRKWGTSINK